MNQDSAFLSSASLKDKAKEALEGKYGKCILASFLASIIILASQILLNFAETTLFSMVLIIREMSVHHLSLDQIQLLLEDGVLMEGYTVWYNALDYVLQLVLSFFTSVFNVGLSLFFLNLACGRPLKVTDIFYGFHTQFGKSLKLAAVLVLINELCYLPANILSYLIAQEASKKLILAVLFVFIICIVIYIPFSLAISQIFLLLLDFPGYSAGELIKLSIHIMDGHKGRLFYIQLSFFPLMLLSLLSLGVGNLWLTPYMNITYTFFFLNLMQTREQVR